MGKNQINLEKLINFSELSREITGGNRGCIRPNQINGKYFEKLDKLFLEDIPNWWKMKKNRIK